MKYSLIALLTLSFSAASISAIKMVSFNIRNFDSGQSRTNKVELAKMLKGLDFDLLSVQEIVNVESFKSFVKSNFPGHETSFSRCGGGGMQKLGFIYKSSRLKLNKSFEDTRVSFPRSLASTNACASLRPAFLGYFSDKLLKKDFVAVNVHLKAGGKRSSYTKRAAQYKVLTTIAEELRLENHKDIVMFGDFNTTGFISMDSDYVGFNNFLIESGFETSSRDINCTSYWSGSNRGDNIEESSVLDHITYPKNFLGHKKATAVVHSHCKKVSCVHTSSSDLGLTYKKVSDHCPISLDFN